MTWLAGINFLLMMATFIVVKFVPVLACQRYEYNWAWYYTMLALGGWMIASSALFGMALAKHFIESSRD